MNRKHDDLHKDLEGMGRLLEQHRAELSALELDGVKRRVIARAARGTESRTKGSFMKSRLAIISMLATGLFMSGTGATLAVDGLSTTKNATSAQYGTTTTTTTTPPVTPAVPTSGQVLGDFTGSAEDDVIPRPQGPRAQVEEAPAGADNAAPAQPTRQVELGAPVARLPFTGYAGITVLLMGLALLGTGLVLRRRTRLQ